VAVGDINGDGVRDIVVGSSPGYSPLVTVFSGATLFRTATVQPAVTLSVAPSFFRGSIFVQAAPTNGGDPWVVDRESVFAELFPVVLNGGVATPLYITVNPFNTGGSTGSGGK
jgi:hypothetical protein